MANRHAEFSVDFDRRLVILTYREELDIEDRIIELPVAMFKRVAGKLIEAEGAGEWAEIQASQGAPDMPPPGERRIEIVGH